MGRKDFFEKSQGNVRKKIKKVFLCLLVGSLLSGNGSVKVIASGTGERRLPSGSSYESIGGEIEQFVEEHAETTAGMQVAVLERNQVIYKDNFGYADVENQIPMDENTALDWGSITKLTVWVSVMQLWEQGELDLNEDVGTYLPEGFLKNLKYDTPVTMMHLMNHNAGFQEMLSDVYQKKKENIVSLEEQLKRQQPEQVYEPGTITAYSNWGTALAGHIVERISGQSFQDYVKEHIFDRLGMEHTAIASDLSDNPWVQEKRKELQCYYPDMEPLGTCFHYLTLYPTGGCVGTLDDLIIFLQAFLPAEGEKSPLFEKEETLEEFLTPTSYFGDTEVILNCHGFWGEQYGVEVLSHGGNATGSSSNLIIEPESGIGMIVLVNQKEEEIYKEKLPELVFGIYSNSELAKEDFAFTPGAYYAARTVLEGPIALLNVKDIRVIHTKEDIGGFSVYSSKNGIEKMTVSQTDYIKFSMAECNFTMLLFFLWIAGIVYAGITLVVGGCVVTPIVLRRKKKKGLEIPSFSGKKWNYISCSTMLLLGISIIRVAFCLTWNAASKTYVWQFVLAGVLGIFMAALLVILLLRWKTWEMAKAERVKLLITGGFLMVTIVAICYWDMYVFWQV